jgi:hypothetical protein
MFGRRWVRWGLGVAMVLLLVGICAIWWIETSDALISRIQVGMPESEVESILGSKSEPYQVLGRFGTNRPGSRLVFWDHVFWRDESKVLLVELDRNSKVAHMVILEDLMAHGVAKEKASLLDHIRACLGW